MILDNYLLLSVGILAMIAVIYYKYKRFDNRDKMMKMKIKQLLDKDRRAKAAKVDNARKNVKRIMAKKCPKAAKVVTAAKL